MLVGRSKGLGGVLVLLVGVVWLLSNYGFLYGTAKWFVPLMVILLGLKMLGQSTMMVGKRHWWQRRQR